MTSGRVGARRGRKPRATPADGSRTVVGRRPALEAVRAGAAVEVLVARSARRSRTILDLLGAAEDAGIAVRTVERDRLDSLARGVPHQGVAARVRAASELDEAALAREPWPSDAVGVVLDGVTDPHNVGAVARTAEAAGASFLVLRRARGAGTTETAVRASAGALLHLPVARVPNLPRAIGRLKEAGFWVVGLDPEAGTTIDEASRPPGRLAVVLGSEGRGLGRLVRGSCDELLSIPLRGKVGSLNVSVAAGIALFSPVLRDEAGTPRPV